MPTNAFYTDTANRNFNLDARNNGSVTEIRVRIPSLATATHIFQYHAKVSGRQITYSIPNTQGFSTDPTSTFATSNLMQIQDKSSILQNSVAQTQNVNHFGAAQIGKIHRRLNAASFTSLAANSDTAIHIVTEIPTAGAHIIKIDGSILNSFSAYHVPLTSTCIADLSSSTTITASNFILGIANNYVFSFYFGTTGAFVGKLILKLVRSNTNTIANTSFIVDTVSGGNNAGNALMITNIVTNLNINL
jgi:hypothetical protein